MGGMIINPKFNILIRFCLANFMPSFGKIKHFTQIIVFHIFHKMPQRIPTATSHPAHQHKFSASSIQASEKNLTTKSH